MLADEGNKSLARVVAVQELLHGIPMYGSDDGHRLSILVVDDGTNFEACI